MPRILLIEDESDSLEMLTMLLQSAGFNVVAVPSKAAAVRALHQHAFDLVLADLLVGSTEIGTAWSAVDELAELARPALVGLITGWPVDDSVAAAHHVAFVVQKPCTRETLFGRLAAALKLPPLTSKQMSMVRVYFDAIEHREFQKLREICTDDVVYQLPGTDARFSHEIRGRDAFVQFTDQTFKNFESPHFEVSAIRPLPSGAMVEYVGHWNQENEERAMPGAVMFELRDDRISRIAVRMNTDELV